MAVEKTPQTPRGTVVCENTTLSLLKANDFVADSIRKEMAEKEILLINMVSSAGSGKTMLLEETGKKLQGDLNLKILVGDLETERDANRLRNANIEALQIATGGICHLEAQMIIQGMKGLNLNDTDVLIIENVGNMVCPASYDLGEDYRVSLIATTEGDDKPKKYPKMFLTSDLMLISKADLLPHLPFSTDAVTRDAQEINHQLEVIQISSLTGEGIDEWCEWIKAKVTEKRGVPEE